MGFLGRIFGGKTQKRSLEAASIGRRFDGAGRISNLNADLFAGANTIRQRSQHMARNNPWVAAGLDARVASTVGTGIVPTPRHPDPAISDVLSRTWLRDTDSLDITGRSDFYGFQFRVVRCVNEAGEAFVHMRVLPEGLRFDLIDPAMVPLDLHRNLPNGGMIRAGIETDADGRVVAIHVYKTHPSDPLQVLSLEPVRIDAADILHIFEPLVPGQTRGLSRISAVMLRALDLDGYEDATLLRAKIANLLTGFVRDTDGTAAGLAGAGTQSGSRLDLSLEPGSMVNLPPGADVSFSDPPDPSATYADYVRNHLRALASGLGCTYEQISSDFSSTNYSSARAALIEHRRKIEAFQYHVLVHQFLRPVWARWVTVGVLRGDLPAAALDEPGADWLPPAFAQADAKAAVEAEILEIENGLKSRSAAAAERGIRVEDLDAQIAADRQREKALSLSFGDKPPAPVAAPAPPPAARSADDVEADRLAADVLRRFAA